MTRVAVALFNDLDVVPAVGPRRTAAGSTGPPPRPAAMAGAPAALPADPGVPAPAPVRVRLPTPRGWQADALTPIVTGLHSGGRGQIPAAGGSGNRDRRDTQPRRPDTRTVNLPR